MQIVRAYQQEWDFQVLVVRNIGMGLSTEQDPTNGVYIARFVNPNLLSHRHKLGSVIAPLKNFQVRQACCKRPCPLPLDCLFVLL